MDDEIEFETAADARRRARESRGTYTRGLRLRKTRGRYCYSTTCAQLETQLQNVRHQQDQLLAEADTLRVKEQVSQRRTLASPLLARWQPAMCSGAARMHAHTPPRTGAD